MDIYEIANRMKLERKSIFDIPLRVTFYARVSSKTDEQLNSIANQIQHFKEFINAAENWSFVDGYIDEVRGESAENRENFMRMIEDGKNGAFDLIITKEVSRFARNTIDSLSYTRDLLRAGVGVFFQSDNICTIDVDSELRLTIMSSIAQDEVRKLSERVKFGHRRSIENGTVLGNSRIYGYDKLDGKLVINETEAEMVRLIFDLYSTGDYSSRAIERILYDKGYRNRNNSSIHHNTINGIIVNPKYKGFYCGNKVKIVDYRTKEQKFLPQSEWKMYKDDTGKTVPQIVDEQIWEKANEILSERSDIIKNREHSIKGQSCFTGKLWCMGHDKPYWRTSYSHRLHKGENIYQWICSVKKAKGTDSCTSIPIYESELYKLLKVYFISISGKIENYVDEYIDIYKNTDTGADIQSKILKLQAEQTKINTRKEKLLELYIDGQITKDEFGKRNDAYNVQISEINEEVQSLESNRNFNKEYLVQLKKIKEYFLKSFNPDMTVNSMSDKQLDEIAKILIDRIEITPIDKNSMKLRIVLKIGSFNDLPYKRGGRRSGQISKKMIDSYKTQK